MKQISIATLLKKGEKTPTQPHRQPSNVRIKTADNTEAYFARLIAHNRNQMTGLQNNNHLPITRA